MTLVETTCAKLRIANNRLHRLFTELGKCSEPNHFQWHSKVKHAISSNFLCLATHRK